MEPILRGIRNSFRNSIRTLSIVVILGLSVGLAVTMLAARQSVQSRIDSVKSSIGNIITVSPAGIRGFEGGGTPLTSDQAKQVAALPHVVKVTTSLNDRLTSSDTNLKSAIEFGSFGQRQNRGFIIGQNGGGTRALPADFTPPVEVIGSDDITTLQSLGGGTVTLKTGEKFDPTVDALVALIGDGLATKNSLSVGSTFTAYGQTFTVKGVFTSGNRFSDNLVVMPLPTVQRLSGQTGAITSAIVQADAINNLPTTVAAIKAKLGDAADVVSQQDTSAQALQPLENIQRITILTLVGSVVAGAVVILLTMLMIVRERRREIGVLKAIGASNLRVMVQFMAESATFTLLGTALGFGFGALGGNAVTRMLVSSSTSSPAGPGNFGQIARTGGAVFRFIGQSGTSLRDITASIGWPTIVAGLGVALVIALVGSAFPTWLISRVRPAEVMRSE